MKHEVTFGIIAAMDSELTELAAHLQDTERTRAGGLELLTGRLGTHSVVLVRCGVGKVSAARCAQLLIDRFAPKYLINTGIAGGIAHGLHVGDFVIGTGLVQHDFDVSRFGYAKGNLCDSSAPDQPTVFRSAPELVEAFRSAAAAAAPDCQIRTGRIATGDCFVCDSETKQRIRAEFDAQATEMEGGAIAQVAEANGVPFIVVRAISDLADEEASVSFDTFEQEAADLSARILLRLMEQFA